MLGIAKGFHVASPQGLMSKEHKNAFHFFIICMKVLTPTNKIFDCLGFAHSWGFYHIPSFANIN
jgi:hypothetical protein